MNGLLKSPRLLLLGVALSCFGAVGAALVSQYRFEMQPCPWCTLQRLIYLVIGALAMVGAALPTAGLRRGLALGALLFSLAGVASALWQHLVAAATTCNLSLADRIMSGLGLYDALPDVFLPQASCADAAVNLLGVPYALWSLALFALCGMVCMRVVLRPAASSRRY